MTNAAQANTRRVTRTLGLAGLLAAALAGCNPSTTGGTTLSIDGEGGPWSILAGSTEAGSRAGAEFNRHGVATAVKLRAHNGDRYVEVHSTFLGGASEPVFLNQKVTYRDDSGTIFERVGPRAADDDNSGIRWDRMDLDVDKGTGHASVFLDVPVCVDHYTGPLEYETRCHQVQGELSAPLERNPHLSIDP